MSESPKLSIKINVTAFVFKEASPAKKPADGTASAPGGPKMKLDKKQVPQLVVLGLLVLTCIGYVSFTVFKPPDDGARFRRQERRGKCYQARLCVSRFSQFPRRGTFPDLSAPIQRRDPFTIQSMGASSSEAAKPSARSRW